MYVYIRFFKCKIRSQGKLEFPLSPMNNQHQETKVMSTLYPIAVRADVKSYPVLYERKRHKTGTVFTRIEHHTGTAGREGLLH